MLSHLSKVTGFGVLFQHKRLSLFAILCLKISFVFLLILVIVRKWLLTVGVQVLQGHFTERSVLDSLESLYFYNFFYIRCFFAVA